MNPRFVLCYGGALGALSLSGVLGVFGDPPHGFSLAPAGGGATSVPPTGGGASVR